MAGQLLLLNPRKRRASATKKRTTKRRRRNPIVARRAAPIVRRRAARKAPLSAMIRRRRNPARRRNPISLKGLGGSSIVETLQNAFIGGGGAIAVDLLTGQLQKYWSGMPVKVSAGGSPNPAYYGIKGAIALAVPMLLSKFIGRSMATKLASGSLTVQAYEIARSLIPVSGSLPLGYYSAAQRARPGLAAYTGMRGVPGGGGGSNPKLSGYLRGLAARSSNSGGSAAEREGYNVY